MLSDTTRDHIREALQCPDCRSSTLCFSAHEVHCTRCESVFRIVEGIPIFHHDESISTVNRLKKSHPLPAPALKLIDMVEGPVLHLGSGSRLNEFPNVVDVDYHLFPNTEAAVDAHSLPFIDNFFSGVVSLNVFEHLSNPRLAASELLRVLKPGGKCLIHTAFLQPFHASPGHYFNATEAGCREWFQDFDIDRVSVSRNFTPAITLSWLLREIGDEVDRTLGADALEEFENSSIGYWRSLYKDWALHPQLDNLNLIELLGSMPQQSQARSAAGFEILSTKPSLPL